MVIGVVVELIVVSRIVSWVVETVVCWEVVVGVVEIEIVVIKELLEV